MDDALQVRSILPTRDRYNISMLGGNRHSRRYLIRATSCQIINNLRGKRDECRGRRTDGTHKLLKLEPGGCLRRGCSELKLLPERRTDDPGRLADRRCVHSNTSTAMSNGLMRNRPITSLEQSACYPFWKPLSPSQWSKRKYFNFHLLP